MYRIEALLSGRLFIAPQTVGDRLYFISNLSGHLSLYGMRYGGSVPEPLLPANIALQNPHLIGGYPFFVFPSLSKILVMIDQDGDENYLPMLIPLEGGFPEHAFDGFFKGTRCHLGDCEIDSGVIYISAESRTEQASTSYCCNLLTGEVTRLAASAWGAYPAAHSKDHRRVVLTDGYTLGDSVIYLWEEGKEDLTLLFGIPLEQRQPDQQVPLNGIGSIAFVNQDRGLLLTTAMFEDTYSPAYLSLAKPGELTQVQVTGKAHSGVGEMESITKITENTFLVTYNIDGVSWLYEGVFDFSSLTLRLERVLTGTGPIANGVLSEVHYEAAADRYALSYSTATQPTQIFTISGKERQVIEQHTAERVLGIPLALLSPGEDASFTSFDGTRISARLYLPAAQLGFTGKRPLVYYVHGGPQSQERPDFAWFSMPLIQFLTLNGFAVFVPNARGSTGYGLNYTKQVDKDWGGQDRLDHVHALTKVLPADPRVDTSRAGVVGRSYGGYMTLTLASRHPELWKGAVDMFGPFDLITFCERIPETWKPYFRMALGDPVDDRAFLLERSPKTHIDQVSCPMLVIQGKNDPRVVERESHDLVDYLRTQGKQVDYLMFDNEGHDVLKYENRVRCYNAITDFFKKTLSL